MTIKEIEMLREENIKLAEKIEISRDAVRTLKEQCDYWYYIATKENNKLKYEHSPFSCFKWFGKKLKIKTPMTWERLVEKAEKIGYRLVCTMNEELLAKEYEIGKHLVFRKNGKFEIIFPARFQETILKERTYEQMYEIIKELED